MFHIDRKSVVERINALDEEIKAGDPDGSKLVEKQKLVAEFHQERTEAIDISKFVIDCTYVNDKFVNFLNTLTKLDKISRAQLVSLATDVVASVQELQDLHITRVKNPQKRERLTVAFQQMKAALSFLAALVDAQGSHSLQDDEETYALWRARHFEGGIWTQKQFLSASSSPRVSRGLQSRPKQTPGARPSSSWRKLPATTPRPEPRLKLLLTRLDGFNSDPFRQVAQL